MSVRSDERIILAFLSSRQAPSIPVGIQTTGVWPYRAYCGLSQAQGGHKVQHPEGPHVTGEQRLAELYPRAQVIGANGSPTMDDGKANRQQCVHAERQGDLLPSDPHSSGLR